MLNHNKAAFYIVDPILFKAMLEDFSEKQLQSTVLSRMGERAKAIQVDMDAL